MIFPISRLNRFFKTPPISKGIVSIWGEFGVGKTTFALQTALESIMNNHQIIYFYTKPIFPIEKIIKIMKGSDETKKKIRFIQPKDFDDLYKIVFNLEFLILENLNKTNNLYKLIVIDSLTDLYRLKVNRNKKEKNYNLNYRLNQILANLSYINSSYDVNILIINEKVQKRDNDQIIEVQSGGRVMEYWVSYHIKIERTGTIGKRDFTLKTSSPAQSIKFTADLTENGFL